VLIVVIQFGVSATIDLCGSVGHDGRVPQSEKQALSAGQGEGGKLSVLCARLLWDATVHSGCGCENAAKLMTKNHGSAQLDFLLRNNPHANDLDRYYYE